MQMAVKYEGIKQGEGGVGYVSGKGKWDELYYGRPPYTRVPIRCAVSID